MVSGLIFKVNRSIPTGISASQSAVIIICGMVLINNIYFYSKEAVTFNSVSKVFLLLTVLISLMLIPSIISLLNEGSIWWAPILVEIMVAHVCVFLQLVIEYFSYREKIQKWRKEQMFDSRYKSQPDESETAARRFIE